jgi:putative acetyltransferase
MRIEPTDPAAPAVQQLLALSDAYLSALYPAESNHLENVAALQQANVAFFGCYLAAQLIGCGAAKLLRDPLAPELRYGEIKRVFVLEAHRGKGVSKSIMNCLEKHLVSLDVWIARLETGINQPQALGLYRSLGYVERSPFGAYKLDPLSVFMEKQLRE